jgi:2-polyprenyl-3-methyl-5-hydroxy-6-metoxy-1,4-benzoquinol methylase
MDKIKKWQDHKGEKIDSVKGFNVIECEACGFKHITPIPIQEELANYYKTEFVGKRPQLIDKIKEDLEWWKVVYAEKYDFFERYFPDKDRRLLDVGCGLGYFLTDGKDRGWDVMGIEPSEQSVKHACGLGLKVLNTTVYDEGVKHLGKFHVVHMTEVLEHLSDPIEAIATCHNLLVSGGLLYLAVPNDYNILQNMLRESMGFKPWWVSPPEHINYFDFASLQKLVEAKGFEVILKTTTFPMEMFLLMGQNYVNDNQLGSECHTHRKNLEINIQRGGLEKLKEEFYKIFAEKGMGREVVLIARKKE